MTENTSRQTNVALMLPPLVLLACSARARESHTLRSESHPPGDRPFPAAAFYRLFSNCCPAAFAAGKTQKTGIAKKNNSPNDRGFIEAPPDLLERCKYRTATAASQAYFLEET
jgi:hypothetical protein